MRGERARTPPLVDVDWLRAQAADALTLLQVDADSSSYYAGHLPWALPLDWYDELHETVRRGPVTRAPASTAAPALAARPEGNTMTTKITLVIDNPTDPDAFEQAYVGVLSAARSLPKLQRLESAKVWPKEDGTPTPAHRTLDLYFDSYEDASAAVAGPEAGAFFGQLGATGTSFTGLFSDVEQ